MANSSNIFGLNPVFFSGVNGDIYATSGLLHVSGSISSTRATFADSDYIALRKQGYLAYANLQDAVESWVSGEAFTRFGIPTDTNQATIYVGEGRVNMLRPAQPLNTKVRVTLEYINIIGRGIDATNLTPNGSFSANQMAMNWEAVSGSIQNLTINTDNDADPTSYTNGGINISTATESALLVDRIKFYGRGTSYSAPAINFNVPFHGIVRNCIFDNKAYQTYMFNCGNKFNGVIENCVFNVIPGTLAAVNFSNTSHGGNFSNCTFSGTPDVALVNLVDSNYIGEIDNCYFRSDASGVVALTMSEFAANNPSRPLITDCTFEMQGPCVSGQMGINARFMNCYMRTEQGDQHCIIMAPLTSGPGSISVFGSRLIANGTGLSVFNAHTGTTNCLIAGSYLRMPNGDTPGSSISSNINNVALSPCNVETPSSITI